MSSNKLVFSMFESSAVTELRFTSKGDICSVIISFTLAVLEIFSIGQKLHSYISLIYKQSPFIVKLILLKNINKAPKKMEIVNNDGNK